MPRPAIRFDSGEPIRTGDEITWAGASGRVVWVRGDARPDPAHPDVAWSDQDGDSLINVVGVGLVLLGCAEPNEDLHLTRPRSACATS